MGKTDSDEKLHIHANAYTHIHTYMYICMHRTLPPTDTDTHTHTDNDGYFEEKLRHSRQVSGREVDVLDQVIWKSQRVCPALCHVLGTQE